MVLSWWCLILKLLPPPQKWLTPTQVYNQVHPSAHTGLKRWSYFKLQGTQSKWVEDVKHVQVLVTPWGTQAPNHNNLGSKTFHSIVRSTAIWCPRGQQEANLLRAFLAEEEKEKIKVPSLYLLFSAAPQSSAVCSEVPGRSGKSETESWAGRACPADCSLCVAGPMPLVPVAGPGPGIPLYFSFPFVPMALRPTVLDNEWCSKPLLFHTPWVTYNFPWVTFDLATDSLIYGPVLWFMSIFSE